MMETVDFRISPSSVLIIENGEARPATRDEMIDIADRIEIILETRKPARRKAKRWAR